MMADLVKQAEAGSPWLQISCNKKVVVCKLVATISTTVAPGSKLSLSAALCLMSGGLGTDILRIIWWGLSEYLYQYLRYDTYITIIIINSSL